jgi:hypothetical protein
MIKNIEVNKEQSDFIWHLIKDYQKPLIIPSTHMSNPMPFTTPLVNLVVILHLQNEVILEELHTTPPQHID